MKRAARERVVHALCAIALPLALMEPAAAAQVSLGSATATFCQINFPIADALDGDFNASTGWAVDPQQGNDQTAVVKAGADIGGLDAPRLAFRLNMSWGASHTIGRFRLSATTSPRTTYGLGAACGDATPGGTAVWNVLSPQQLLSQNGQTLTVQPDGSVLASGGNPLSDEVAFVATTSLRGITGFRLEVLADPSFPVNGPGRASNGNFVLTELLLDARTLPSIPTLETWALALTALMLMLSAVGLLRRRRG